MVQREENCHITSALAWIMFIIVCILTIIAFTSQKKWVYYSDER